MAKQKVLFRLEGSIDDYSFYKSKDGYLVRRESRVNARRMATNPTYQRTRENDLEFGAASKAAKFLRLTVLPMMGDASDSRVISRITGKMTHIKELDNTGGRGERTVAIAIGSTTKVPPYGQCKYVKELIHHF